jgi:hypothetical protein
LSFDRQAEPNQTKFDRSATAKFNEVDLFNAINFQASHSRKLHQKLIKIDPFIHLPAVPQELPN